MLLDHKKFQAPEAVVSDLSEEDVIVGIKQAELVWAIAACLQPFLQEHYTDLLSQCWSKMPELRSVYGTECATRILWLTVKTHLGSNELFWHPLFKMLTGRVPFGPQSRENNEAWDMLLAAGYKALGELKEPLPDHAGWLPSRIPNLLT